MGKPKIKRNGKRGLASNGKPTLADRADKFLCYQLAVQSPDNEVEFFEKAHREAYARSPVSLREDFCGTFAVCCEWVKTKKSRIAIGVDLCAETLQWGRDHNLSKLKKKQRQRIQLLEQDVRTRNEPRVDVLAAQNFSFWIFKTRPEVLEYFRIAHANLNSEGVMVMDMMGGGECFAEDHVDKKKIKRGKHRFSYLWEQSRYNPVNADASFYISFKFQDGSCLKRAFAYHWRFWTIPEVRELLAEAGFRESHVYWETEDENGEDTGIWERGEEAPSHPSWLAYIVAVK
jgi:hypothetical protein